MHTRKMHGFWTPFVFQLLFIMFFVEFVKGALLVSVLPLYLRASLGLSVFALGWAFALQYIGDNVFRGPVGWLIDTVGYRWTVVAGIGTTLAAVALFAFTRQPGWAVLGCFLLGAGTSPLWPSVVTGTTEVAGEKASGTIMSVVYIAWMAGTGAGPTLINFFVDDRNFTVPFRILLIITVLVFAVSMFLPGRNANRAKAGAGENQGDGRTGRQHGIGLLERIKNYVSDVFGSLRVNKLLYPAMFLQTFALGVLTPIVTLYAREDLKLSSNEYSLFLIIGGAATLVFLYPVGKLTDKWGTRWFLHIGIPSAAAATASFAFVHNRPALYAAVIAVGFSYALVIPAWNALVASAIPKRKRGAVWGFFLTIEGAGFVVGPVLSGMLWDAVSHGSPFLLSGAVLIALFVLHLFISLRKSDMVT
ncbi:MFS transporter [Paenibacillus alkalitolerans]|uniref:MFS transporter n=1 Tax=Paenibacillus alkalitolerans TaxID=2799335 RepID=UPI001F1FF2AD|nr:MFS transporter [Paenibacillus alkalitolerans]